MKTLILLSLIWLWGVINPNQSHAFFGIHIKIKYERGTKQWNPQGTLAECVGGGTCSIEVEGGTGLSTKASLYIGRAASGNLSFAVKNEDLNSEEIQSPLGSRKLHIGKPLELSEKLQAELSKMGFETSNKIWRLRI